MVLYLSDDPEPLWKKPVVLPDQVPSMVMDTAAETEPESGFVEPVEVMLNDHVAAGIAELLVVAGDQVIED